MRRLLAAVLLLALALPGSDRLDAQEARSPDARAWAEAEMRPVGAAGNAECVACHSGEHPFIVQDWRASTHASEGIGCLACHEARRTDADAMAHYGATVSALVSPKDCAACHETEAQQFAASLHSVGADFSAGAGAENPLNLFSDAAAQRSCYACHGVEVEAVREDGEFVRLTHWPNQGIGRINPDGSKGSCSACHTHHRFSVVEARKPQACAQCHLGPDHPQIEIYAESKHGNIFDTRGDDWNWQAEELTPNDVGAPTCTICHMSGFGVTETTHDVSARLYWELETPISVKTDGLGPDGEPLRDFWMPANRNPAEKRAEMKKICAQCHTPSWIDGYFESADATVRLYNETFREIDAVFRKMKADGLLDEEKFNEPAEFHHFEAWHHAGRRMRFGAFMQGPDYVMWHGTYDMRALKAKIEEIDRRLRAEAAREAATGSGTDGGDRR